MQFDAFRGPRNAFKNPTEWGNFPTYTRNNRLPKQGLPHIDIYCRDMKTCLPCPMTA